jgi:hypothetical protein
MKKEISVKPEKITKLWPGNPETGETGTDGFGVINFIGGGVSTHD